MSRIRSAAALAGLLPLVAGCSSGSQVVLTPQNTNLWASPPSMTFSMSNPSPVAFSIADKASNAGTITINQNSCNGIASYQAPASIDTIGRNPGVNQGGGSSYTITPLGVGRCTIRISDSLNDVATIYVVVTQ